MYNITKIDILLATYNGANFLSQQLRSLQNQTLSAWELWIHDDGSTDATLDIIRDFMVKDERIHLIEDGICYKNPAYNFLSLLPYSKAPFSIFCDQDDIWLENKLQILYDKICELDNNKPTAVYSNSYVYETDECLIGGRASLAIPAKLEDLLFMNGGIQGCAILFNKALRDICINAPKFVCMHDHLLTLAAITFGQFVYINKNLMLYRRYNGTVTGHTDKRLIERFRRFFRKDKHVLHYAHNRAIHEFFEHYKDSIPDEKYKVFEEFCKFSRRGKLANIYAVFHYGYNLYGSKLILAFKLLVRPL